MFFLLWDIINRVFITDHLFYVALHHERNYKNTCIWLTILLGGRDSTASFSFKYTWSDMRYKLSVYWKHTNTHKHTHTHKHTDTHTHILWRFMTACVEKPEANHKAGRPPQKQQVGEGDECVKENYINNRCHGTNVEAAAALKSSPCIRTHIHSLAPFISYDNRIGAEAHTQTHTHTNTHTGGVCPSKCLPLQPPFQRLVLWLFGPGLRGRSSLVGTVGGVGYTAENVTFSLFGGSRSSLTLRVGF